MAEPALPGHAQQWLGLPIAAGRILRPALARSFPPNIGIIRPRMPVFRLVTLLLLVAGAPFVLLGAYQAVQTQRRLGRWSRAGATVVDNPYTTPQDGTTVSGAYYPVEDFTTWKRPWFVPALFVVIGLLPMLVFHLWPAWAALNQRRGQAARPPAASAPMLG